MAHISSLGTLRVREWVSKVDHMSAPKHPWDSEATDIVASELILLLLLLIFLSHIRQVREHVIWFFFFFFFFTTKALRKLCSEPDFLIFSCGRRAAVGEETLHVSGGGERCVKVRQGVKLKSDYSEGSQEQDTDRIREETGKGKAIRDISEDKAGVWFCCLHRHVGVWSKIRLSNGKMLLDTFFPSSLFFSPNTSSLIFLGLRPLSSQSCILLHWQRNLFKSSGISHPLKLRFLNPHYT